MSTSSRCSFLLSIVALLHYGLLWCRAAPVSGGRSHDVLSRGKAPADSKEDLSRVGKDWLTLATGASTSGHQIAHPGLAIHSGQSIKAPHPSRAIHLPVALPALHGPTLSQLRERIASYGPIVPVDQRASTSPTEAVEIAAKKPLSKLALGLERHRQREEWRAKYPDRSYPIDILSTQDLVHIGIRPNSKKFHVIRYLEEEQRRGQEVDWPRVDLRKPKMGYRSDYLRGSSDFREHPHLFPDLIKKQQEIGRLLSKAGVMSSSSTAEKRAGSDLIGVIKRRRMGATKAATSKKQ